MGKFEKGNKFGEKKSATVGIAKYIREQVGNDYKKLVDELIHIATAKGKFTPSNRMKAIELLLNRSLGYPHQSVSEEIVSHSITITNLPPATTLEQWETQVEQARIARGVTAIGTIE